MATLPARPNHWVRRVIVGWALFLGAFGAWGWSATSAPSAFVSLFACGMMLNASHQLRMARGRRFSTFVWGGALLLFGAWSGYSAHHAVSVSRTDLAGLESYFLLAFFTMSTLIDPFLMWAVVDTEEHVAAKPPVPATLPEGVVDFQGYGGRGSATLAAAMAGVAGLSAGADPGARELQPPTAIFEQPARTGDGPEALAGRMLRSGVSIRMTAARTGLTRYAVTQIKEALKAQEVA